MKAGVFGWRYQIGALFGRADCWSVGLMYAVAACDSYYGMPIVGTLTFRKLHTCMDFTPVDDSHAFAA